jgi:TolB-like protein
MNLQRIIITLLSFVVCGHAFAQDIDTELSKLADKLATQIKDQGKKKIAVIDFTDLQGGTSELGKYIAEQLTVDLVMDRKDFSVLDRANLKSILAEHKLTATGLIDPDTAKKLGMFAGVDALILGNVTPKGQNISVTAKIITTDTAEIVGAGRAQFAADANVQQLITQQATGSSESNVGNDTAKVTKKLGNLSVGLQSLEVVNGGRQYLLTMTLANISVKKSIWVAMSGGMVGTAHQTVTDPNGYEFVNADSDVTGVASTLFQIPSNAFTQATEIKPGDSTEVTIKLFSLQSRNATAGQCRVQLGFLIGDDFNNGYGQCSQQDLYAKMDAE